VRCVACSRALSWDGTRHDADMPLCWVGLVALGVSARASARCHGSGERGAGWHVRDVLALRNKKNRGCFMRAMYNARLGRFSR
jgi:hypothetical protein